MGDSFSCFISLPELQVIVEANLFKMYQNGITKESMGENMGNISSTKKEHRSEVDFRRTMKIGR